MLHQFLSAHRDELVRRCVSKAAERFGMLPNAGADKSSEGVPLFLDQLIRTLEIEQYAAIAPTPTSIQISGPVGGPPIPSEIGNAAAHYGRRLSELGYTVEQVVHEYGDLCQAMSDLAVELEEPISVAEFRIFNRCLDNGIAGAVAEFSRQRRLANDGREQQALNQRIGVLAHEFRNHLNTVTHAVSAIKSGQVGFGGATGKVLDRSLARLRAMLDNSMADVRLTAGLDANLQVLKLADLVADTAAAAQLEAQWWKCQFSTTLRGTGLTVIADPHLLASALGNLLQNAFKFTQPGTKVSLTVYADEDRIHMDVQDQSGGLLDADVQKLFLPFTQNARDKSGLGLGLSYCQRAVEANHGTLSVRDLPGSGSIFSIILPRHVAGD